MIVRLLLVALVLMGASHTIAKERVFEPLRKALGGKATWFGYLVSCPYCNSHWIAFALVPLAGMHRTVTIAPQWGIATTVIEWFLSCVCVVTIAAFLRIAFYLVDESQGLARRESAKTDAETDVVCR